MPINTERLCLGTVQFGLQYGINNQRGKPSREEVFAMLDLAVTNGIKYIDTAAAYGNAEDLLGEYLRQRADQNLQVISKLRPNSLDSQNSDITGFVVEEIKKSLNRLKIEALDGFLLHTPSYFYNPQVMRGLAKAKKEGLIRNLGVSIYETQHALDIAASGKVDYIQIPYNILDQRLDRSDFFQLAGQNRIKVFARSPFLQGLLFMEADRVPEHLAKAGSYIRELDRILTDFNCSRLQACMAFSILHKGIDKVVFGVDHLDQLAEDIDSLNQLEDKIQCVEELRRHFADMDEAIIFPSLWASRVKEKR